ncbi:hypothetical protein [Streptomyces sp. NPDC059991]|uniref:hypothetical protein n=1 Tax=unclassified Streptomyces TaxID=2593676 RepID=UPI0036CAEEC2
MDDHQARHAVEVEAALTLGGEAGQGVVDAGDVAAVRHRRQVLRPQVGDPLGVEDQGVGALLQELGDDGAQVGRAAPAVGGADRDVRRVVDVDGDRPSVGADADERAAAGSASSCAGRTRA